MVLIVSSYTVFNNSLYRWQFYCPVAKTILYKCCFSLKMAKWLCTLAVNHYWSCPVFQNDLRWICTNSLVHDCSWFEERFDCFQFALEQEDKMHWFFWMRGNPLKKIKGKLSYPWAVENCFKFVSLLSLLCIYIFFYSFAVQYVQRRNCCCVSALHDYNNWCWLHVFSLFSCKWFHFPKVQVYLLYFSWKADNTEHNSDLQNYRSDIVLYLYFVREKVNTLIC